MEKAIKLLEQGDDSLIRQIYSDKIEAVLQASDRGEIGFIDFIQNVRALLNDMDSICGKHWKEFN